MEGNGEKEERGRSRGGKGPPADFRYSLRYSPTKMLDLSGRLAGRGVQRGEGRREGEEKKGEGREIGNGGVALAPNSCGHPCFNLLVLNWFIDAKLLVKMDTSFQISLRLHLILLLQ